MYEQLMAQLKEESGKCSARVAELQAQRDAIVAATDLLIGAEEAKQEALKAAAEQVKAQAKSASA